VPDKPRPVEQRPDRPEVAATTKRTTGQSLPRRVASVWAQIDAWRRATPQQRRSLAVAVSAAHQVAQDNRQRVLAHAELAERLTHLGCSRPERWTGYIPPRVAYYEQDGYGVPNDSPVRRGLVELMSAVAEREASS
jgi:hypothetical protein